MAYVLEDEREFARLERQSQSPAYDFKSELRYLEFPPRCMVLDVGCGSGIVTRYLSSAFPQLSVTGCDSSSERIRQASQEALRSGVQRVSFEHQDITQLTYPTGRFDVVVARFVLEHLSPIGQSQAMREIFRVLKPGGQAYLIDIDGYLFNLYPGFSLLFELQAKFETSSPVDLCCGRRLPYFLHSAGFEEVQWRPEVMDFSSKHEREIEASLIEQRFALTLGTFATLLGSEDKARQFQTEYLRGVRAPGSTLFYNKFIAWGRKPGLRIA